MAAVQPERSLAENEGLSSIWEPLRALLTRTRTCRHPMATSGSVKGGAILRSGSLRQVSVRGFENLAQGDSTLFHPEPGSNADVDEAYFAAARAATLKLQMGNAKATAAIEAHFRTVHEQRVAALSLEDIETLLQARDSLNQQ